MHDPSSPKCDIPSWHNLWPRPHFHNNPDHPNFTCIGMSSQVSNPPPPSPQPKHTHSDNSILCKMPQWPQERRKLPRVNLQGSPSKGKGLTEVSQVVSGPQHRQMGHADVQHCTRAKKGKLFWLCRFTQHLKEWAKLITIYTNIFCHFKIIFKKDILHKSLKAIVLKEIKNHTPFHSKSYKKHYCGSKVY